MEAKCPPHWLKPSRVLYWFFFLHQEGSHLPAHMPSAARDLAGSEIRLVFLRAKTLRAFLAPFSPTYSRRTTSTGSLSLLSVCLSPLQSARIWLRWERFLSRPCVPTIAAARPPPRCPRKREREIDAREPESLQLVFRARRAALRRIRSWEGETGGGGSGRSRHAAASQPRVRAFTRHPVADLQEPFFPPLTGLFLCPPSRQL